jgi:hypothetical protein
VAGLGGEQPAAAQRLGFPVFATKNTTRVGGADPVADAAAVSQAVYPATSEANRPAVVALSDAGDWRTALAASVLMAAPLRAPLLFSQGHGLPAATADALRALRPVGSRAAGGARVISVGGAPHPGGLPYGAIGGADAYDRARAIDAYMARVRGGASEAVIVVSAEEPAYAMPAAGWAAKSGDPILFVHRDSIPVATRTALAAHQQPKIYVLGPGTVITNRVVAELRRMGTVHRIRGADPVSNAVAFARFIDGPFGWGAVDPGHGLVFASSRRPLDAAAAAPLSASGSYGPLLVLDAVAPLSPALDKYLLDIEPGYARDPVRGVYNHGWLIGDAQAIPLVAQGRIDTDLEIVPIASKSSPTPPRP